MAEDFRRRQQQLQKRLEKTQRSPNQAAYNKKSPIHELKKNLSEAEQCFELYMKFDDGTQPIAPEIQRVALARRSIGLSSDPPSIVKRLACGQLKLARLLLAEAYESISAYDQAIPLYHLLVEQALKMRTETFEDSAQMHHMMNNLGLCYKHNGDFDKARAWYQRGLQTCEREAPGSPAHKLIQNNISCMVAGAAGPATMMGSSTTAVNNGGSNIKSWKKCWTCGISESESNKIHRCSKCYSLKVSTPAYYCGVDCQRKDWERHKAYHRSIKNNEKLRKKSGFSILKDDFKDIIDQIDPENEYEKLRIQAIQARQAENPKKARRLLEKAIKLNPLDAIAHHDLGGLHCESNSFADMLREYAETMRLAEHRTDSEIHKELWAQAAASINAAFVVYGAECALLEKPSWMVDPEQYMQYAERAVKGCPSYNETWGMLAMAYEDRGDLAQALRCFRKAEQATEAEVNKERFRVQIRRVEERFRVQIQRARREMESSSSLEE